MSLPKLNTPTYFLTVPSSKKKIKFRPFLVKEEKIMMLVKESNNDAEILEVMKDVIGSCTFNKIDPDSLATFDIEYIFLQLRSKSVGERIELNMKCVNEVEIPSDEGKEPQTKPCGGIIPFDIDISKIEVNTRDDHTNIIILDGDVGVTFRYPSLDNISDMNNRDNNDDIDIIVDLIENIFDKDNVYDASDTDRRELVEFIESITQKQFMKIKEGFFDTIPALEHTEKYKCSKCGYEDEYTFRGITDFF